ncbi:MAG: 4-(cytidine 5'-diphospho)-2-C-methyl-D-erythritol kinase [Candidatus Omnitrophica bacterium]|nr:4-(cytidine 5'-diphospho)-2-C-methyl-D-erythritol kinase [Candidatus Omnitrophota bacterium]
MLRLRAPAKLNLYLRILGRRPDGYHELETLFERLDLADELAFEQMREGLHLTCDDPGLSCGEDNLALQAARLLQRACEVGRGAAIRLTKRIPIAAGLGGGSSDAATTLVGLNQLWNTGRSVSQLCELAAQVGSDVPFFLHQHPFAIGRGRGERCEVLTGPLPALWHVVVTPKTPLSTPEIYADWDAQKSALTQAAPSITMAVHALRNGPAMAGLAKGLYNDLEPAAIRRCPVIGDIRALLLEGACQGALTSGSGPSVFGLCQDRSHAEQVAHAIHRRGASRWTVHVVRTARDGE